MKNEPKIFCKNLNYKDDELFLDEFSCNKLYEKYGSPLYCYSLKEIRERFISFQNIISEFNSKLFYAVKANYNPKIVSYLAKMGAGADVVSKGEIELVISSGIKTSNIVFSGVGKSQKEIEFAIDKRIYQINVESEEELEEIQEVARNKNKIIEVSLRVNPDVDAYTHRKISTGRVDDKFGIAINKIENIFKKYRNSSFVKITGLAIHIGSQITKIKPFSVAFKKLRKLILLLNEKKYLIKKVDLGGGIGIAYSSNKVISLEDYKLAIKENFGDLGVELLFEPGRYLVGSSGILISKVIRVKKGINNDFLIIDCGMNDLIRPSMYDSYHEVFPVFKKSIQKKTYNIVGPICESGDILGNNRKMQMLKKNDLLVICSVGAYGSCMSSHYNCRIPANEILVEKKRFFSSNKIMKLKNPNKFS